MDQFPKQHSFHIPVMGLAFTIDSPIKVARFGITSVISIVEDQLIEMMRKHYSPLANVTYCPIGKSEEDYRARRITNYLDLVNRIVKQQINKLKSAAFIAGSEIVQYFEMLPENSQAKKLYRQMLETNDIVEREQMVEKLREWIVPGSIDVNIMTKIDNASIDKMGNILTDGSEAVSALRGFANSGLQNSSVIFSAGLNPRLYSYLEKCSAFDADANGIFHKKVIVKVSDYRSALVQGKYLAKKGIWVSEFRIESGLNCGGHAFATNGFLLGPILEEFKTKKAELIAALFEIYATYQKDNKGRVIAAPHLLSISVQGGIGTAGEDAFLHDHYAVNTTGWGTPFLLVPEATTVDANTLELLCKATKDDIVLGDNSPLGVKFHYLKGTSGEMQRLERIDHHLPGSACAEKHLAYNTTFSKEPICTASRKFQRLKIAELEAMNLPEKDHEKQLKSIQDKECLCVGLSNAAAINYSLTLSKNSKAVTICPGPNIAYFSKIVSLKEMVDHIYGRSDIMGNIKRPNMFISELGLYINYLKIEMANEPQAGPDNKRKKYYSEFFENLKEGIVYYTKLPSLEHDLETLKEMAAEVGNMEMQFNLLSNMAPHKLN